MSLGFYLKNMGYEFEKYLIDIIDFETKNSLYRGKVIHLNGQHIELRVVDIEHGGITKIYVM
jgi:hypothetical protein